MSTDPMLIGERLLLLLDDASLNSTYKPALLMALLDRCSERVGTTRDPDVVPLAEIAQRVAELYWPQTRPYPESQQVLSQNAGAQAKIIRRLVDYRHSTGALDRRSLAGLDERPDWADVVGAVEVSLAEMPVPRLQQPYEPFLYDFDWPFDRAWRKGAYLTSSRAVHLRPGVAEALVRVAPLLRPFIARWWTDKAAALNRNAVPHADALVDFEEFLFGKERVPLRRLAESLLDLQDARCFYCGTLSPKAEVDHFFPWSHTGDDGVDNLVMACSSCNNGKRAVLPAAAHVERWVEHNTRWVGDLRAIAREKEWPQDRERTRRTGLALYARSPDERPTWTVGRLVPLGPQRDLLLRLLG